MRKIYSWRSFFRRTMVHLRMNAMDFYVQCLIGVCSDWLVSAPGLVKSVSAVNYYFCLNMPATFMQPRALKISVPGLWVIWPLLAHAQGSNHSTYSLFDSKPRQFCIEPSSHSHRPSALLPVEQQKQNLGPSASGWGWRRWIILTSFIVNIYFIPGFFAFFKQGLVKEYKMSLIDPAIYPRKCPFLSLPAIPSHPRHPPSAEQPRREAPFCSDSGGGPKQRNNCERRSKERREELSLTSSLRWDELILLQFSLANRLSKWPLSNMRLSNEKLSRHMGVLTL